MQGGIERRAARLDPRNPVFLQHVGQGPQHHFHAFDEGLAGTFSRVPGVSDGPFEVVHHGKDVA